LDKKAKNILVKTYWSAGGWNRICETSTEDFEYAKSKGLMFDPITISGREIVSNLERLLKEIPLKTFTDEFLCSMTNKRLDWRSSLGSYANAQRIIRGKRIPEDDFKNYGKAPEDLNVLNFERIKWGGVRHYIALYNYLDLLLISKETIPNPTPEDISIFKEVLIKIETSNVNDTPSKLRDNLKGAFKGSSNDRGTMMEIHGSTGILNPNNIERAEPSKHDWHFPLFWRGEDKYDSQNVKHYFGTYGIY
jgi:hypothetical protein